jgi:hypothetical protein
MFPTQLFQRPKKYNEDSENEGGSGRFLETWFGAHTSANLYITISQMILVTDLFETFAAASGSSLMRLSSQWFSETKKSFDVYFRDLSQLRVKCFNICLFDYLWASHRQELKSRVNKLVSVLKKYYQDLITSPRKVKGKAVKVVADEGEGEREGTRRRETEKNCSTCSCRL